MSDLITALKKEAKIIAKEEDLIHGHALEELAVRLGFRDWNTLRAIASYAPLRILNKFQMYKLSVTNSEVAQSELGHRVQSKRPGDGSPQTLLDSEADFRNIGRLKISKEGR